MKIILETFINKAILNILRGRKFKVVQVDIQSKIKGISEFNIGHFLIGESVFIGIKECIKTFKKILAK